MRTIPFVKSFVPALGLALALFSGLTAQGAQRTHLSRADLLDKIRGGWAGQMIGVAYGAPTEFRATGRTYDEPLTWGKGRLENAIHQDDVYVEMTFAAVMDRLGLNATSRDYGRAFRDSQYSLWHANAGARRALNQGIDAPWSGHPKYNFHANDIDFQIEADFIGLMCPGLPRESNKFCDRVGRVMNYGDGLYGGMFVCGMYSAAFFEKDPRKVVEAGLACIPAKSEYGRLIRDLLDWSAQNPADWRKVWQQVEEKWDRNDPCPDGALSPFNIDAKLNGAYIAFGLLFGGGDFAKTLEISTRCGQDSDCNPSSAGGVLGVMLGFNQIPDSFKADLPFLETTRFDYTEYCFNDIVKSTETRALALIRKTGGTVNDTEVVVRVQSPKPPKLEQWNPGTPQARLNATDSAFTFTDGWKNDKNAKVSMGAGNEMNLRFTGTALALIGALDQNGGRAEVFVDGRRKGIADAYIVERTYDNVLWSVYDLKPGEHTVRLVTLGQADQRSGGKRVTISGAVTYTK